MRSTPRLHDVCRASNDDARKSDRRLVIATDRRALLLSSASFFLASSLPSTPSIASTTETTSTAAVIDLSLTPDQTRYDPSDPRLREAARLIQQALNADSVTKEEALWTEIIETYSPLVSQRVEWAPDVVGRAVGNRGNARARQGRLKDALSDYNESIKLCPWSVDPVLNRGAVYEALGRFDDAIADYKAVLRVSPQDPAAFNNLGNAYSGLGLWSEASENYERATRIAPQFSFAAANKAIVDFQLGDRDNAAFKELRTLLRRYPEFPDARAALAAGLWTIGKQAEAEEEWGRVNDPRYRDIQWLKTQRRWPPRLVQGVEAFLSIKDIT